MRTIGAVTALLVMLGAGLSEARADTWAMLDLQARGVPPAEAATFRDLLQGALLARTRAAFVQPWVVCEGSACARDVGAAVQARRAVFGWLAADGDSTRISVFVVDVATGTVAHRVAGTVRPTDDRDHLARRMARAIVGVAPSAHRRARVPIAPRLRAERRGRVSAGLAVGGAFPAGEPLSEGGAGLLFDGRLWYEEAHWAFEVRAGTRFSTEDPFGQAWIHVPVTVGGYWLPLDHAVTPVLGGGVGAGYVSETLRRDVTLGTALAASSSTLVEEQGWGVGVFGQAGLMVLRGRRARILLLAEVGTTLLRLHGRGHPLHVNAQLALMF